VYITIWTILFNLKHTVSKRYFPNVIFREIATESVCNYTKGNLEKQYLLYLKLMNVKMIILLIELVVFSPRLVICKYLNTMILDHSNEKMQFKEEEKMFYSTSKN